MGVSDQPPLDSEVAEPDIDWESLVRDNRLRAAVASARRVSGVGRNGDAKRSGKVRRRVELEARREIEAPPRAAEPGRRERDRQVEVHAPADRPEQSAAPAQPAAAAPVGRPPEAEQTSVREAAVPVPEFRDIRDLGGLDDEARPYRSEPEAIPALRRLSEAAHQHGAGTSRFADHLEPRPMPQGTAPEQEPAPKPTPKAPRPERSSMRPGEPAGDPAAPTWARVDLGIEPWDSDDEDDFEPAGPIGSPDRIVPTRRHGPPNSRSRRARQESGPRLDPGVGHRGSIKDGRRGRSLMVIGLLFALVVHGVAAMILAGVFDPDPRTPRLTADGVLQPLPDLSEPADGAGTPEAALGPDDAS